MPYPSSSRFRGSRLVILFLLLSVAAYAAETEHVIIRSTGSRSDLKAKVRAIGGTIDHEFQNVNAVSASIPTTSLSMLKSIPEFKVRKSLVAYIPAPRDPKGLTNGVVNLRATGRLSFDTAILIKNAKTLPNDYLFNNTLINATPLQAAGDLGQGIVVAVIDTGTANNPAVVPALDGTVIGGESFVPLAEDKVKSATSTKNHPHGTWVGTMIAAHVGFVFPESSCLARSVKLNAPDSIVPGSRFGLPGTFILPMVGVAPAANIYALKVFPSSGAGAPSDRIIAAMDRVITIKKNFLKGMPSVPVSGDGTEEHPFVYDSLNIQVVNMSLGGPTLDAGRDVEDELTRQMPEVGITLATAAGNAGPAFLTTGSPATGLGSISSAAANTPAHERIFWDVSQKVCAVGLGLLARPNNTIQTASFSSRGPTADGRVGVDVISAGFFNFVEGADGGLSLVAGTSFSSPSVAGAAALLQHAVPQATATQIRNAIPIGANPNVLGDKSTQLAQGKGYLDVTNSFVLLQQHKVPGKLPAFPPFSADVAANIAKFNIVPHTLVPGLPMSLHADNLVPGQTREFLIKIGKDIGAVQVQLTGVTPQLPAEKQNQIFGDDLILAIHQAKTSEFGSGDYPVNNFFNGPASFTIGLPEPGYMRVAFVGDWTNAGSVSATLTLIAQRISSATFSQSNQISEGDLQVIPLTRPSGLSSATFELTWDHDWSHYPTNDLDLIVADPEGHLIFDGATLNGRETVTVKNPKPGNWTMLVSGFTIFGKLANDGSESGPETDIYRVRVFEH